MRAWFAVALLMAGLAGCLEGKEPANRFPSIEARVAGGGIDRDWSTDPVNVTVVSTQTVSKPSSTVAGGGGGKYNLSIPAADAKVQLRILNGEQYEGAKALWVFRDTSGPTVAVRQVRLEATEELTISLKRATNFIVSVDLFWEDRPQEHYNDLIQISVNGRIIVDTTVHPIWTGKGPRPSNHETMSDQFSLRFPDEEAAMLKAETMFRGAWPGPHGTNIDLTLLDTSPKPAGIPEFPPNCSPRVPPQPRPPSPDDAKEAAGTIIGSQIEFQVGLLHAKCPRADEYAYANPAPVPYRLVIDAVFQTIG